MLATAGSARLTLAERSRRRRRPSLTETDRVAEGWRRRRIANLSVDEARRRGVARLPLGRSLRLKNRRRGSLPRLGEGGYVRGTTLSMDGGQNPVVLDGGLRLSWRRRG